MPFIHLFTRSALLGWAVLLLPVAIVCIVTRLLQPRAQPRNALREHRGAITLPQSAVADTTRQRLAADRVAYELACAGLLGNTAAHAVMRETSCRHATAVAAVDTALAAVGPERAYWNCPEHWPRRRPHLLVRLAPEDIDPDDVFAMNITFDRIDGDQAP